jgi:hypothetical protein
MNSNVPYKPKGAKYFIAPDKVLIQFKCNLQTWIFLHQRCLVCYNFEKSFNSTHMYPINPNFLTSKVPSILHPQTRFLLNSNVPYKTNVFHVKDAK